MALQLHKLLSDGYFPQELPPPFSTHSYADAMAGHGVSLPQAITHPPHHSISYTYNLVRAGGLRRNLGIPNPKHFYRLANHVVTHWVQLKALADASPFSLTKPIEGTGKRAISPQYDLNTRYAHLAKLRSTSRFILKADISRFFPSIYTHSLPWAILGKSAAKASHMAGTLAGTWEDKIDMYCRGLVNNQTVGIPIGPDTSRLLAEVLLARVDLNLQALMPNLRGIRFIDDYEFAFASRSEAEQALGHLQQCLYDFDLALNPHKTSIKELPETFESTWVSAIRSFEFRVKGTTGQKNDLTAYFDMVFNLYKAHPEENILKYAIARLGSVDIDNANWGLFENILCHAALIEPACLPQLCDQLVHYKGLHYPINNSLWSESFNRIVIERVPLGQVSEASWAMWVLKVLNIPLEDSTAIQVANSDDSSVALMALGLSTSGLANPRCLSNLHTFARANYLYESQWLLCYQGNFDNLLGAAGGHAILKTDPIFNYLMTKGVSFFNINVAVPPPIRHGSLRAMAGAGGSY